MHNFSNVKSILVLFAHTRRSIKVVCHKSCIIMQDLILEVQDTPEAAMSMTEFRQQIARLTTQVAGRPLDAELDALLAGSAAVSIEGPKGVGKTATAERRAASVVRLDEPAQREAFAAAADRLTGLPEPILLDEWQRLPTVWDAVRRAVATTGSVRSTRT